MRGFFENGGEQCYVVPLEDSASRSTFEALEDALHATEQLNTIDLVCAPDIFADSSRTAAPQDPEEFFALYTQMQQAMVQHCADVGGRFAILDVDRSADWATRLENGLAKTGPPSTGPTAPSIFPGSRFARPAPTSLCLRDGAALRPCRRCLLRAQTGSAASTKRRPTRSSRVPWTWSTR